MISSTGLQDALSSLSPERRALLAARLKQTNKDEPAPKTARIQKMNREGDLPLSFSQRRLWFLDQLNPGMSTYNIPAPVHMIGALDAAALENSIREIIRRHDTLRTVFPSVEGRPRQMISPDAEFRLSVVDLQHLNESEREKEGSRLTIRDVRRPFDLAQGPLIRALLFKLGPQEHALLLTVHHIISDGWSMGVLIGELRTLYEAFAAGRPSPLKDLPIQYVDYVNWKLEQEKSGAFAEQLSYWKRQLADLPLSLDLPTDRQRPPSKTFNGSRQTLDLSIELSETIRQLCKREGVTMFMTLLAVFKMLLSRYANQEDIVVGTPIANRNQKEIESLIGFFANTLVLRTDLSGNPTFRELLQRVRGMSLAAYSNQDLPFERLVEKINPDRDLGRQPLFQVMFVYQNTPPVSLDLPNFEIRPYGTQIRTAKFDLTFTMEEIGQTITGSLEYNTDLYDAATIARMLEHFQRLLEGAVAEPDRRIWDLPMLTRDEDHLLIEKWNATARTYPKMESVRRLFETQAALTPGADAAIFEDTTVSYDELNRRANRLAHYLIAQGVGPDIRVAVYMQRSIEMLVAVLGVLKAGGAYVPLDPAYPAERLAFMLQDSGSLLVLTQTELLAGLTRFGARALALDQGADPTSAMPETNPQDLVHGDNLAYLVYTSGSTGRPKGVAMTQASLINLIQWQRFDLGLEQPAKTLQLSSLSFDASFNEMFSAWYSGGAVVLISENLRRDPEALTKYAAAAGVERIFPPYAALQQMAEIGGPAPEGLRETLSTAEQLQINDSIIRLFKKLDGGRLHNEYGPSETHVVTTYTLEGDPEKWETLPPIGRPIANTTIYLLDRRMTPVPPGATGELYIGGVSLARGYLDRPDLTAERFTPHPFGLNGERLYRTGDLARYRPDGNLECLGRLDHQIKIRGFRIEPGEIEAALAGHPAVREAAVAVQEDQPGNKRLVAYLVSEMGAIPPAGELYEFLRASLPDYMLPSAFAAIERLPLTPSGKIDRKSLPTYQWSRSTDAADFTPPTGPAEQIIADVWARLLGLDQVGIKDNFFALGGHSLLVTQVVARLRDIFQIELPIRSLFEAPTVEGLLSTLVAMWGDRAVVDEIAATALEIEGLSADEVDAMLVN